MALALLISAPVTEEVLCRSILMDTLKKSFSVRVVIIASAVVFGVMHAAAGGVILVVGAIFMGLIFAIVYEKTGSLPVAVIAHAVANLPDFLLYSSPQIVDGVRIVIAVIALTISIVSIVFFMKGKIK